MDRQNDNSSLILRETHSLKSDINGVLLLTDRRIGLINHEDESVRKKIDLLKNSISHMLNCIKNIEILCGRDAGPEFDDFIKKFDLK